MTSIQTQGDLNLKMMLQLLVLLQLGNAVTGKMECCLDFSSWASPSFGSSFRFLHKKKSHLQRVLAKQLKDTIFFFEHFVFFP